MTDAERAELAKWDRVGRWRVDGRTVFLFERPEREPTLKLVETTRDPSVRMRVELRQADGQPALGVFVGEGAGANPHSQLDEGVLTIPCSYDWETGTRQIVREGDDRSLASFALTPDGPNVFRFVYTPSEVEPFEVRARVMDRERRYRRSARHQRGVAEADDAGEIVPGGNGSTVAAQPVDGYALGWAKALQFGRQVEAPEERRGFGF